MWSRSIWRKGAASRVGLTRLCGHRTSCRFCADGATEFRPVLPSCHGASCRPFSRRPPMSLRLLVVEGNTAADRARHAASRGATPSEAYAEVLRELRPMPSATCLPRRSRRQPAGCRRLEGYDGVALTGSSLNLYDMTPEIRSQIDLARQIFASGTPVFGSCWGLQVLTTAAGGVVRRNPKGREMGFARKIVPNEAGRAHPMLAGRPIAFDAPAVHQDEVETMAPGTTLLASNGMSEVQAVEIRVGEGLAWAVQYHPEFSLAEVAAIGGALGTASWTRASSRTWRRSPAGGPTSRRSTPIRPTSRRPGVTASTSNCSIPAAAAPKSPTGWRRWCGRPKAGAGEHDGEREAIVRRQLGLEPAGLATRMRLAATETLTMGSPMRRRCGSRGHPLPCRPRRSGSSSPAPSCRRSRRWSTTGRWRRGASACCAKPSRSAMPTASSITTTCRTTSTRCSSTGASCSTPAPISTRPATRSRMPSSPRRTISSAFSTRSPASASSNSAAAGARCSGISMPRPAMPRTSRA